MSQHDYNIANQGFSSFRSDLNNALSAIQTTNSGTSRPTGAVAGQIWLDTTSATSPTLKFYDGADDISFATIDYTANTVNWLDSNVSVTGLTTTATGTVMTLTDSAHTTTVNMILGNNTALRFNELTANGTNYIGLKAPASLSADLTFTLPSTDGTSGQFLKTDGSGNLSFASLSFATPLAVVGDATAGASIRLPEDTDNGSNYVAIKAPDNLASNLTLTLPSADGTSGQVLQTNGSGVLSFATPSGGANTPAFYAYNSTVTTMSSGAVAKIDFQTEILDTANNFASSRFTPTTAGYYFFNCQVALSSATSTNYALYLFKNGGAGLQFFDYTFTTNTLTGSGILYANGTTDYFEVYMYQASGGNKTTTNSQTTTFFSGFRLIGA
jgi:hypothetical protein